MAQAGICLPRSDVRSISQVARDSLELRGLPLTKKARANSTKHKCDICGIACTTKRSLVRHQRTSARCRRAGCPIPSYPCDHCGQEFNRLDLRHRHEKEVHFNISRSTGHVRRSTVTGTETTHSGGTAPSQLLHPIHGSTSTPNASYRYSPPRLGTSSTPQTELELAASQIIQEHEMVNAEMDCFRQLSQALDMPGHEQGPPELDMLQVSSISEQEPPKLYDMDLDKTTPELTPDTASIRSISTVGSAKTRFLASTNRLRSTLISKGATPRVRGYKLPVLCVLCNEHLGSNIKEVRAHLDQHSQLLHQIFLCHTCQVSFAHERDLILHKNSAAEGHCGFDFDHIEECNGHHPPHIYSEMLNDNDRLQFTLRLQHWEQAQLNAYINQVNDLMHAHRMSRDGDCWSIDALFNSLVSLSSTQGYRRPRSALESVEQLSRLDSSRLTGCLG